MLPYSCQTIEEDDVRVVVETLRSPLITQGPRIEMFEKAIAAYCGSRFAVAFSSGTAALHAACLAAGVKPGSEVVTSPLTFVASANCAFYCGAEPRFVDIDPQTRNLSPPALERHMGDACRNGQRVAAVIPVHYGGFPCEIEQIAEITGRSETALIEDACHALGARWRDRQGSWHRVGDCSRSDMTVFSFHPVKGITTGEGGAVTTNERRYYQQLLGLRSHGIVRRQQVRETTRPGWYYEVQSLGFNYRITDLQCALGHCQLQKVGRFLERRAELAQCYRARLSKVAGVGLPPVRPDRESANHLFAVRINQSVASRDWVYEELAARGIGTQVHYIPVHLHPYYRQRLGLGWGDFPAAEAFYREALSLPLYPSLSAGEQAQVVEALTAVLGEKAEQETGPGEELPARSTGGIC